MDVREPRPPTFTADQKADKDLEDWRAQHRLIPHPGPIVDSFDIVRAVVVEVTKLSLKPTDTLVITVPHWVQDEDLHRLANQAKKAIDHQRVVVVTDDMKLSVVERAE
jgi:hypothetical protein